MTLHSLIKGGLILLLAIVAGNAVAQERTKLKDSVWRKEWPQVRQDTDSGLLNDSKSVYKLPDINSKMPILKADSIHSNMPVAGVNKKRRSIRNQKTLYARPPLGHSFKTDSTGYKSWK